ncbi:hypothetical protein M0R19_03375 [Candidatus Pacearchaeota archaeon]|jgi:transposase-like protein|nr:hypothetical protein [Candidatus Pacearchaeota archaeon]
MKKKMVENYNDLPKDCPLCKKSLKGHRIPESVKKLFDNAEFYNTVWTLYNNGDLVYKCPSCNFIWK